VNDPAGRPVSKGIQAIETGFRVLLAIQQGPAPMALKDIAARAEMSPGQAHNYLTSFVRTEMVEAVGRGQYRLGPSLAALGMTAIRSLDKYEVLQAEALRLRASVRVGVAAALWGHDLGPIFVFNRPGDPEMWGPFDLRTGPASVMGTGAGNVFLAYLDPAVVDPVALRELTSRGMSHDEAAHEIADVRRSVTEAGFAHQTVLEMPGYASISAPVWDATDQVCYALTLTGPKQRISSDPYGTQASLLLASVSTLSRMFGASAARWSHLPHVE
jgi:DNA-binding IclR family transcriptional regulator